MRRLRRTLFSRKTTCPPLTSWPPLDAVEQFTKRAVLRPLCFSLAFDFWPCMTAWLVPTMAGHAATAVMIPKTMFEVFCDDRHEADIN
jgi:hypothetical protein